MKIGRNDPCPCDSGIKYKKCCAGKQQAGEQPAPLDITPQAPIMTLFNLLVDAIGNEGLKATAIRSLERFAEFLGLVEIERDPGKRFTADFRLRKLPLLDHVVQFQL